MRLSVDNGDYGWDVWLDGVLQKYAVMADDEKGEVERYNAGNFFGQTEKVYGKVEIRRSEPKGTPKPANVQGLVAPVWSDSGCPYKLDFSDAKPLSVVWEAPKKTYSFEGIKWPTFDFTPPKVSTAKDALPKLTRVSGNKRGPGWCDE